jgi:hypothetical protein
MIEETVPCYILGSFGIATNLAFNGGKMLALLIGAGVPDALLEYDEALGTHYWRFVFALPLLFIAIQLIIFLFFIREETIKYSINHCQDG